MKPERFFPLRASGGTKKKKNGAALFIFLLLPLLALLHGGSDQGLVVTHGKLAHIILALQYDLRLSSFILLALFLRLAVGSGFVYFLLCMFTPCWIPLLLWLWNVGGCFAERKALGNVPKMQVLDVEDVLL